MTLTPEEIEAERRRFEAATTANHISVNFRRDCTGGYEAAWVHHRWHGWLAAIESERERASENAIVSDMAMLIKRMARSIAVGSAGANGIANKALDYLKRKGLQGSILRDEKFENERRERWENEE